MEFDDFKCCVRFAKTIDSLLCLVFSLKDVRVTDTTSLEVFVCAGRRFDDLYEATEFKAAELASYFFGSNQVDGLHDLNLSARSGRPASAYAISLV